MVVILSPHHAMKCCFIFLFFLSNLSHSFAREWTNTSGKALEGELISATDTEVEIKFSHNGRNFTIPLNTLSENDQTFVSDWLESNKHEHLFSSEWPRNVKSPELEITIVKDGPDEFIYHSNHYEFIANARLTKVPVSKFAEFFEASRKYLQELPLGNSLAFKEDLKHKVYLFEHIEEYVRAGAPPDSAGVFMSGTGRNFVMVPFASAGLKKSASGYRYDYGASNKTLSHEIVHQVTDPIYYQPGTLGWYTEGLAEYIALTPYNGSTFTVAKAKNELKEYVTSFSSRIGRGRNIGESFEMRNLKHYMNMDYAEFTGLESSLNYGVSALLFTYFAHFEGDKKASNLIAYLKAIKGGANAKESHNILFAGRSYEEVQEDFAKNWRSRGVKISFR